MGLTEREWQVWNEIKQWELQLPNEELTEYNLWLNKAIYYLPTNVKEEFFSKVDNWLFHIHAMIQNSQLQVESQQKILTTARIFDEKIQQIEDLKQLSIDQLTYISEHQIVKHRLFSVAQGSLTGTGNSLFITTDLLAMAVINLRAIQLVAMSFGFDSKTPYEMMVSLKVFHHATLPKKYQKYGWDSIKDELNHSNLSYFYTGSENITDEKWLEQTLKQIIKSLFFMLAKQNIIGRLPVVGAVIGASINYKITRQVTEFAEKFYQVRFLLEKKGAK